MNNRTPVLISTSASPRPSSPMAEAAASNTAQSGFESLVGHERGPGGFLLRWLAYPVAQRMPSFRDRLMAGQQPLELWIGVRVPVSERTINAAVAQMARASPSYGEGRGFEACRRLAVSSSPHPGRGLPRSACGISASSARRSTRSAGSSSPVPPCSTAGRCTGSGASTAG
jgi:hypothetical protein